MQLLTYALAAASLIAPILATPLPVPGEFGYVEARAAAYAWNATQVDIGHAQTAYTYDFHVSGPQGGPSPNTPSFKAVCSGTNKGGHKACEVNSFNGKFKPKVSAEMRIVKDPKDANDNVPKLFVRMQYNKGG